MEKTMFVTEPKERKSHIDDMVEEMSGAGGSSFEKFLLGDPAKKDAQNQKTLADAEMTKAMANLATSMANQPTKSSGIGTTGLIIGSVLVVGILVTVVVIVAKKGGAKHAAVVPSTIPEATTI